MTKFTDWIRGKPDQNQNGQPSSHQTPRPQRGPDHHQRNQNSHQQKNFQRKPNQPPVPHPRPEQQEKVQRFRTEKLLKIMPMAGLEEVGKNMNAIEYGDEIVTIDCGLQFPEPGMFGIDYVIPDTTYLEQNKKKIKAMLITHGHLDHIGALRHILPKLGFPPVYASALTIGMIEKHISENGSDKLAKLHVVENGKPFKIGSFEIEYFMQNHSIPDSNGIVIRTPVGNIVHSGDYKFDFTPAVGQCVDFQNLARIGAQGVLAFMGESTNATKPGYTISEKKVAIVLEQIIEKAKGRVIIASFSSLMGRIHQILEFAHKNDRKIFISGRSMMNNIEIGTKLGFIKPPKGVLAEFNRGNQNHPAHKTIILCTGSQGEGLSALNRISLGEHRDIQLKPGDTIVLSSSPIIGNEKAVVSMKDRLLRQGVQVITNEHMDVHTSGHARQEELKLMLKLLTPRYLIPVHGEYHMRHAHKDLAVEIGMDERQVILADNGDIIETDGEIMRRSKSKIPANNIFIEGTREGEEHLSKVQLDRQIMSENGVVIIVFRVNADTGKLIASPGIDSRGLTYINESPEVHAKCVEAAQKAYEREQANKASSDQIKLEIKRATGKVLMQLMNRNPIIMPVIVKV